MTGARGGGAGVRLRFDAGWPGAGSRRWKEVADVAYDRRGNVHVLTRFPAAVVVLAADGTVVGSYGQDVLSPRPHGITVGPDGTAYVVDDPMHVVRVFDPAGRQERVIGSAGLPSDTGVDDGLPVPAWTATVQRSAPPFNPPTTVAVAGDGGWYVSDGYGNARVHRFDADGELSCSWGEPGSGPGQFMLPHSVTVLTDGRVLVVDRENDRLQFFTPDGAFLGEWTGVQRPTAAVEDAAGRIWVAELPWEAGGVSHRRGPIRATEPAGLRLLDAEGATLGRWEALPGGPGLIAPHGLCLDDGGALYLAEVSFSLTRTVQARSLHRCLITPDQSVRPRPESRAAARPAPTGAPR